MNQSEQIRMSHIADFGINWSSEGTNRESMTPGRERWRAEAPLI